MSNPDIQYFASSGTWAKPPRAVRVDVVLAGGDGGDAMEFDGESFGGGNGGNSNIGYVPNPSVHASFTGVRSSESADDPGTLSVMSYAARDLPGTVEVEVGKGGRPGGRDGYALIVTHLSEDQASTPAPSAWDRLARDVPVATAPYRDGADVLAEVRQRHEGDRAGKSGEQR